MWSVDRLHLSPHGHAHVCAAVLEALGVAPPFPPPPPESPAPPPSAFAARRADLAWGYEYFLPWVGRRLRGRSSGDGVSAKRPILTDVLPVESDSLGRGAR
jgi:hypothetical protein